MSFLYPGFLWALFLLLIPIIIHLFNFKRYKTLYFSSLQFIKHVDQKTKSTQQLKHILILISRLLALTFLVLAFAQPFSGSEKSDQTPQAPIYCMYIDNSFSMQAHGHEGELLSEAREKAKEIINKAPVDALFMIGTNEMSGREEHLLNKADAFDKVDQIDLSPFSRKIEQILDWQEIALNKVLDKSTGTNVEYLLFSDFQKINGKAKERQGTDYRYFPVQLLPENTDNILIDSVWFDSPVNRLNENNQLNIRIANYSKNDRDNIELTIRIGKLNKTIFTDVPAGTTRVSSFTLMEKEPGFKEGTVTLNDKQIFFDDTYYFSYEVSNHSTLLIIDGEDAVDNMRILFDLDHFYQVTSVPLTSLTREALSNNDLVILNGVNKIPSGIQSYLKEFHQNGGSLALFPGRAIDPSDWNSLLNTLQMPGIGSKITSGTRISNINYEDPFFKGVFEKKTNNLNLPSVNTVYQSKPGNSRSNMLIELQNGMSLLSYQSGKGNILAFYSSLHPDFGKFTQDALFTTVLLKIAALSQRKQPMSVVIGKETMYPIYRDIDNDRAVNVRNAQYEFIPQIVENGGVNYIVLSANKENNIIPAGNYRISQEKELGTLSLNNDRIESNLTPMTEDEIINLFGNVNKERVKLNTISSDSSFSTRDLHKPMSYWKICIIISLIFVITEMLLVRLLK